MRIRISKIAGFGRGRTAEFSKPRIILGTAASSDVRFDPAWDKTVSAEHLFIESDGREWFVSDNRSAAGTFIAGVRLADRRKLSGPMEIELGRGGPRVHVDFDLVPARREPGSEAVESPHPSLSPQNPLPIQGKRPGDPRSPFVGSMALYAGAGLAVLLLFGAIAWLFRAKTPSYSQSSQIALPPEVGEVTGPKNELPSEQSNSGQSAQSASANSSAGLGSEAEQPRPNLSSEEQSVVEKLKSDSQYAALRRFWSEGKPRSPYIRGLLQQEDVWFKRMIPWLPSSGGAQKRERPGIFVGECFGSDFALSGTPLAEADLLPLLTPAVGKIGAGPLLAGGSYRMTKKTGVLPQKSRRDLLQQKLTAFSASKSGDSPRAFAVLIGINEFQNVNGLWSCRNDVAAIAKVLATQGVFDPERIRLLTDAKSGRDFPTKENVLAALRETLDAATSNDLVLIAFSTHGTYDKQKGDSVFCTVDANPEAEMLGIYGQELQSLLGTAKARNILIVVDACHSGGAGAIGGAQSYSAGKGMITKTLARANIPEKFYEMLGASRGHVVIRACRSEQTTPDLYQLGQSYLTTFLLAGLTGEADANADGIVTLSELRIYITTAIPKASRYAAELGEDQSENHGPLEPTFTSGAFGEAGDLPLTVLSSSPQ